MTAPQLLRDRASIAEPPRPGRPAIVAESFETARAVGMEHVWRVPLRRQRQGLAVEIHPRVESVHQHQATRWRRRRMNQKRVVPARTNTAYRSRGKSSETVGFQPLSVIDHWAAGGSSKTIAFVERCSSIATGKADAGLFIASCIIGAFAAPKAATTTRP